jgi:hypothetical protein
MRLTPATTHHELATEGILFLCFSGLHTEQHRLRQACLLLM